MTHVTRLAAMSKKLSMPKVPTVPGVPGVSRRQQYSASTKKALVKAAERLFTASGYAATSLDAIVADAKVTKGALYHHYSGKQALFEAVFADVEERAARQIEKAVKGVQDPWEKSLEGLRAFLEVVREPTYRRVVVQEGPAVLGHERFREQEERSTFAIVLNMVRDVLTAGTWELDDEMLETFSRIFFGALSSAGEAVSDSDDPAAASARVEIAIGFLIAGIRGLVESGVELPEPGAALVGLGLTDQGTRPAS
jgi:AcrR family transcriptional regulator